jgi:hypothetical protein
LLIQDKKRNRGVEDQLWAASSEFVGVNCRKKGVQARDEQQPDDAKMSGAYIPDIPVCIAVSHGLSHELYTCIDEVVVPARLQDPLWMKLSKRLRALVLLRDRKVIVLDELNPLSDVLLRFWRSGYRLPAQTVVSHQQANALAEVLESHGESDPAD